MFKLFLVIHSLKAVGKGVFYVAIKMVESTGFWVRGFVCDMRASNRKLLSEIGVTQDGTRVKNHFGAIR